MPEMSDSQMKALLKTTEELVTQTRLSQIAKDHRSMGAILDTRKLHDIVEPRKRTKGTARSIEAERRVFVHSDRKDGNSSATSGLAARGVDPDINASNYDLEIQLWKTKSGQASYTQKRRYYNPELQHFRDSMNPAQKALYKTRVNDALTSIAERHRAECRALKKDMDLNGIFHPEANAHRVHCMYLMKLNKSIKADTLEDPILRRLLADQEEKERKEKEDELQKEKLIQMATNLEAGVPINTEPKAAADSTKGDGEEEQKDVENGSAQGKIRRREPSVKALLPASGKMRKHGGSSVVANSAGNHKDKDAARGKQTKSGTNGIAVATTGTLTAGQGVATTTSAAEAAAAIPVPVSPSRRNARVAGDPGKDPAAMAAAAATTIAATSGIQKLSSRSQSMPMINSAAERSPVNNDKTKKGGGNGGTPLRGVLKQQQQLSAAAAVPSTGMPKKQRTTAVFSSADLLNTSHVDPNPFENSSASATQTTMSGPGDRAHQKSPEKLFQKIKRGRLGNADSRQLLEDEAARLDRAETVLHKKQKDKNDLLESEMSDWMLSSLQKSQISRTAGGGSILASSGFAAISAGQATGVGGAPSLASGSMSISSQQGYSNSMSQQSHHAHLPHHKPPVISQIVIDFARSLNESHGANAGGTAQGDTVRGRMNGGTGVHEKEDKDTGVYAASGQQQQQATNGAGTVGLSPISPNRMLPFDEFYEMFRDFSPHRTKPSENSAILGKMELSSSMPALSSSPLRFADQPQRDPVAAAASGAAVHIQPGGALPKKGTADGGAATSAPVVSTSAGITIIDAPEILKPPVNIIKKMMDLDGAFETYLKKADRINAPSDEKLLDRLHAANIAKPRKMRKIAPLGKDAIFLMDSRGRMSKDALKGFSNYFKDAAEIESNSDHHSLQQQLHGNASPLSQAALAAQAETEKKDKRLSRRKTSQAREQHAAEIAAMGVEKRLARHVNGRERKGGGEEEDGDSYNGDAHLADGEHRSGRRNINNNSGSRGGRRRGSDASEDSVVSTSRQGTSRSRARSRGSSSAMEKHRQQRAARAKGGLLHSDGGTDQLGGEGGGGGGGEDDDDYYEDLTMHDKLVCIWESLQVPSIVRISFMGKYSTEAYSVEMGRAVDMWGEAALYALVLLEISKISKKVKAGLQVEQISPTSLYNMICRKVPPVLASKSMSLVPLVLQYDETAGGAVPGRAPLSAVALHHRAKTIIQGCFHSSNRRRSRSRSVERNAGAGGVGGETSRRGSKMGASRGGGSRGANVRRKSSITAAVAAASGATLGVRGVGAGEEARGGGSSGVADNASGVVSDYSEQALREKEKREEEEKKDNDAHIFSTLELVMKNLAVELLNSLKTAHTELDDLIPFGTKPCKDWIGSVIGKHLMPLPTIDR